MHLIDPVADASLTFGRQGCALEQAGETLFLIKFLDIVKDSMLAHVGEYLIRSDESASSYRTGQFVIGKRMTDPVPEAAPPPAAD